MVDVVYIVVLNSLYKDYVVMCLKVGKYVLGEKFLVVNSVEFELIIEVVKEN